MPTVVIIHAAEDALPARALAEKLRAVKLTPMIELAPGETLRAAVRDAAVTLALWSPRSVGQAVLIEEVAHAKTKTNVIHARMQNAPTPTQFASEQSIDLTGWRGEEEFPGWRQLALAVTEKAGVPAPPPQAQRPQSGFFQPGAPGAPAAAAPAPRPNPQPQHRQAPPPQQRAAAPPPLRPPPERPAPPPSLDEPRAGAGKGLVIVLGVLAVVALGVGGYFVMNNMQGGAASSTAWENVPRNDASALRAFIEGNPGEYREAAVQALSELEEQSFDAAREEDTVEAFEQFVNEFPNSDQVIEARGRIAELNSMPPEEEAPEAALPPEEAAPLTDPDLLPPGAEQAPAPDAPGGPVTLTPPAPEEPAAPAEEPAPAPDLPLN